MIKFRYLGMKETHIVLEMSPIPYLETSTAHRVPRTLHNATHYQDQLVLFLPDCPVRSKMISHFWCDPVKSTDNKVSRLFRRRRFGLISLNTNTKSSSPIASFTFLPNSEKRRLVQLRHHEGQQIFICWVNSGDLSIAKKNWQSVSFRSTVTFEQGKGFSDLQESTPQKKRCKMCQVAPPNWNPSVGLSKIELSCGRRNHGFMRKFTTCRETRTRG